MKLMLMRELREGWRSFRLPGVLLGAVFFALLQPPSQKYMDVIMGLFAEGIEIELPPVTPDSVLVGFAGDLTSMILIAAIVVCMGIVAREKHNGLTEWFLTRPVSRSSYVYAKVIYLVIFTLVVVAVSTAVCAAYTSTLVGSVNVAGVFYLIVLVTTYLMLPLIVTLTVSAITGISGAAAGAGILVLFLMSSLGWLLDNAGINWLPTQLSAHLPEVIAGYPSPSFWVATALSWLFIALMAQLSNYNFARQEV
ncbi:ABC transporter permease [Dethiobacter alkaliphilus]|uniref:ABC transporter permease n=1 Tax=Dethiobacter alkaliphilus TaxID=427926 RepID=UPI0022268125|nr:ABC transporter permease [Dethiobacter alkaliphilus]MCW3491580.1 ABC transporter permease [Dethiobacter alkaliphilus]